MRPEQLNPCPFCGAKPVRNDDISATGFAGSTEEDQIYYVACMTKGCQPEGICMPDMVWNSASTTQETLMEEVFVTMKIEQSANLKAKQDSYKDYLKRI